MLRLSAEHARFSCKAWPTGEVKWVQSPQEQTDFLFTCVYRVPFENGIFEAVDYYDTKLRQETISGASLKPFYCFEILLSSSKMILMNPDESFSLIIFHQTCHVCFLSELALTDSWIINSFDVIGQAALQKVWNCSRFSLIYSDSWLTQWIFAAVSHI